MLRLPLLPRASFMVPLKGRLPTVQTLPKSPELKEAMEEEDVEEERTTGTSGDEEESTSNDGSSSERRICRLFEAAAAVVSCVFAVATSI